MSKEKKEIKLKEPENIIEDSKKEEFPREYLSIVARRMQDLKELIPTRLPAGSFIYKDIEELELKAETKKLLEYMIEKDILK